MAEDIRAADTFEPTQLETEPMIEFSDTSAGLPVNKPWARLVNLFSSSLNADLLSSPMDMNGKCNVYLLGRSTRCDIRFESPRVSNVHCTIFCQKKQESGERDELEACIEDNSANGTYINRDVRLRKSARRIIHNGDEISLINPESGRDCDGVLSDEVRKASFVIQIFLGSNLTHSSKHSSSKIDFTSVEAPEKASTIMRLLYQERNIRDYYSIRHKLGGGTSGQVTRSLYDSFPFSCVY